MRHPDRILKALDGWGVLRAGKLPFALQAVQAAYCCAIVPGMGQAFGVGDVLVGQTPLREQKQKRVVQLGVSSAINSTRPEAPHRIEQLPHGLGFFPAAGHGEDFETTQTSAKQVNHISWRFRC